MRANATRLEMKKEHINESCRNYATEVQNVRPE